MHKSLLAIERGVVGRAARLLRDALREGLARVELQIGTDVLVANVRGKIERGNSISLLPSFDGYERVGGGRVPSGLYGCYRRVEGATFDALRAKVLVGVFLGQSVVFVLHPRGWCGSAIEQCVVRCAVLERRETTPLKRERAFMDVDEPKQ